MDANATPRHVATSRRGCLAVGIAAAAGAVAADDFGTAFPDAALRSRDRAIALGRELEGLLVGVYLNGALDRLVTTPTFTNPREAPPE